MSEFRRIYVDRGVSPMWRAFTNDVRNLKIDILNPAKVRQLIATFRDPATRQEQRDQHYQELFNTNIRLLHHLTYVYSPLNTNPADSISEVFEQFDKCIKVRFNMDYKVANGEKVTRFSSFLSGTVRKTLLAPRALFDNYPVHVPDYVQEFVNNIARFEQKYAQQNDNLPSDAEIIDYLSENSGTARKSVSAFYYSVKNATIPPISIEREFLPIPKEEQDDFNFPSELAVHNIPDSDSVNPEDAVIDIEDSDEVLQQLDSLPARQRYILLHRMGFVKGREHTLEEIGSELGITGERVRQLEVKAFTALRNNPVLIELNKRRIGKL